MGTRITVVRTGQQFEPLDITQSEDVFSHSVTDSAGGTPMLTVTLPPHINFLDLVGEAVTVDSSHLGLTSGIITEMTVDNVGSPACILNTKLNPLVSMARAKPFVGTLTNLIKYYFSLAGIHAGVEIDGSFSGVNVNMQGWEDVIWTRLSKLQSIYKFEVVLISDFIAVRPWRKHTADVAHIKTTNYNYSTIPISRTIELDYWSNRHISNAIVYPIGNKNKRGSGAITADARETTELEVELEASLSSIKKPKFVTSISESYSGTESLFTVVDKDGYALTEDEWKRLGGRLNVEIGADSKTLKIAFTGPNLISRSPYRIAYAPLGDVIQTNGTRKKQPMVDRMFNSLHIVGSGVGFTKRTVSIRTGARPENIISEVGAHVSEPEISSLSQLYNAAFPVLTEASGGKIVISGTLSRINQRNQTGITTGVSYERLEDLNSGETYGSMEDVVHSGMTVNQVERFYNQYMIFEYDNQAFGNSAGARIFDPKTARWYRITKAEISMHEIAFEAEDDLTVGDMETWSDGMTYGYVEDTLWPNITYWKAELKGLSA